MVKFTEGSARERVDAIELAELLDSGAIAVDDRRRRPLYQDGRFLTAADLTRDQTYFLTRQADLGRAGGFGVVQGLVVTAETTTGLRITAGHGITPAGELVILPESRFISLTDVAQIQRLNATFGLSSMPNEPSRNLSGLFVLALRPVEYTADPIATYPTSLTGTRTVQDGYIVEAAAITLIPYTATGSGDPRLLRSHAVREIFLERSPKALPADALPLAMLSVRRGIVDWVDPFMVRREVGSEQATLLSFGMAPRALREAHVQQYDQHLRSVMSDRNREGTGQRFSASAYFDVLPPAGRMPVAAIDTIGTEFTQLYFPPTVEVDLAFIPSDEIAVLIEESLLLPPIDLTLSGEDLDSTAILVLIPVFRERVRQLKATLPMPPQLPNATPSEQLMRRLISSAPGQIAKRQPLEAIQRLRLPRIPQPSVLDSSDPTDRVWQQELAAVQGGLLWYVRRRSLPYRTEIIGTRISIGNSDFLEERRLGDVLDRFNRRDRFRELSRISTAAANANMVALLSSPKLTESKVLMGAALEELDAAKSSVDGEADGEQKLDQQDVFQVAKRFTDPKLGEGFLRLEAMTPDLQEDTVAITLARSQRVPELDRVARLLPAASLPSFTQKLLTTARSGNEQEVHTLISQTLEEIGQ